MDMRDLRPAREFARKYGCKAIVYGPPGTGKTPILAKTSPRPILVAHEPGTASLWDCDTPTYEAYDVDRANQFYTWFLNSAESSNFDTLIVDSASELMRIYLKAQKAKKTSEGNEAHGQRAYGKSAEQAGAWLEKLYAMPQKHIMLICKQEIIQLDGINTKRPAFDGNVLPRDIPHLYDCILHLDLYHVPTVPTGPVTAVRCRNDFGVMARNRTGKLDALEPPVISQLTAKYMS